MWSQLLQMPIADSGRGRIGTHRHDGGSAEGAGELLGELLPGLVCSDGRMQSVG